MSNKKEIYNYCEALWDQYKLEDGGYFPSKHDKKVFQEAAEHFNMDSSEIEEIWHCVSKIEAGQQVKGLSKKQIKAEMFDIVKDNAETPWGKQKP